MPENRYSMDSAIAHSTMLAIGPQNFRAMLEGFHEMDEHFRAAPLDRNLPILMGLLAFWYNNLSVHRLLASFHRSNTSSASQPIIPEIESKAEPKLEHDSSTNALIRHYRTLKETSR